MSRSRIAAIGLAIVFASSVAGCGSSPDRPTAAAPPMTASSSPDAPLPTVTPIPGHEVYGFVPYWEMDDGIAVHLRSTPLTTIGLFSVTNTGSGAIDTSQNGYRRIMGPVGEQIIREAHGRGTRVELVFTSFGSSRNTGLFESRSLQDATITSLVSLAGSLGVDGVNVDVESLDPILVPAYGVFVNRLRTALVAADPAGQVSVATTANALGAAMAEVAVRSGADRVFLMGYDYRSAGSNPGASAPLARRDGSEKSLAWSLDMYAALGVPADRTLLGLPLYGMTWPVAGPVVGAPATGPGETWILRQHLDVLRDPSIVPVLDAVEEVEVYLLASDGTAPPPASIGSLSPGASPAAGASLSPGLADRTWRAVYVDSPATLAPKLALANARGLAGAGFWAIGYERGLPGYTALITRFGAGDTMP